MMGQLSADENGLFYEFCLENYVPQHHLLRQIDPFLDLGDLRTHLSAFYSPTGRPSVDPEVMIRMLIIDYCYGIRSERRRCEEVHLNLANRWFCRLGLEGKVPDHSDFSENRHGRFRDSNAFRQLFEVVLQRCLVEGLVGGEGFTVDASVVKADASRQRHRDDDDDWGGGRAVREYLQALSADDTATGSQARKISPTDPAASYTAAPGGPAFYACSTNYLADTRHGIIMDVESTTANRRQEVESTRTMIEQVEQYHGIRPQRLIGDTAYGTAHMLHWIVDIKQIEPHTPVWDKTERRAGSFGRSDFILDAEADHYVCPAGKSLLRYRRPFRKPRSEPPKAEDNPVRLIDEFGDEPDHTRLGFRHIEPNVTGRPAAHSPHSDPPDTPPSCVAPPGSPLFAFTSLSMRMSSACSAIIFLNSVFSRSSSFNRRTSGVCMPPYSDASGKHLAQRQCACG